MPFILFEFVTVEYLANVLVGKQLDKFLLVLLVLTLLEVVDHEQTQTTLDILLVDLLKNVFFVSVVVALLHWGEYLVAVPKKSKRPNYSLQKQFHNGASLS